MALPAALVLSGLNESHFSDGLKDVFSHGALLLKSPKSANKVITKPNNSLSLPNLTPVTAKELFFDLLVSALQSSKCCEPPCTETERTLTPVSSDDTVVARAEENDKILYGNRDILDLASNMKSGWRFPMAQLQDGTQYFFENRSQYTRVLGSNMPKHVMVKCPSKDCCFETPRYDE